MRNFFVLLALASSSVTAIPVTESRLTQRTEAREGRICPTGIFFLAQCCSVDVVSRLDIDCRGPKKTPNNIPMFKDDCSQQARTAKCCAFPFAGQDLLCQDV